MKLLAAKPRDIFIVKSTLEEIDLGNIEPTEGFEPTTYGLQNRCSTTELRRHF